MRHKTLLLFLIVISVTACNTQSTNRDTNLNTEAESDKDNRQLSMEVNIAESDIQPEKGEYLTIALEKLNISYEDCKSDFITEKILPYDTEKSLIVIPKISHKEDDFYTMDAYIVIIDHKTHEIVHMYHKDNEWTSDAMQLTGITIDTAPYILNASTRAFGIRLSYLGSSRVSSFSGTFISLFIPEGKKLVKILEDYPVVITRGESGMGCEGYNEWTETFLIMTDKLTNGYKDILAKSTITTTTFKEFNPKESDCDEEQSTEYQTNTICFDAEKYKSEECEN